MKLNVLSFEVIFILFYVYKIRITPGIQVVLCRIMLRTLFMSIHTGCVYLFILLCLYPVKTPVSHPLSVFHVGPFRLLEVKFPIEGSNLSPTCLVYSFI